jgi:hypothetical protein
MAEFKYFGTTVTDHNFIHEEPKSKLNSGNTRTCDHSFQNILSSRPLSKSVKIKMPKTLNLPVVLYGSENLSLTLREEHKPGSV